MAAPANPMTAAKESERGRLCAAFPRQPAVKGKRVAAPLGPGSGEHGSALARAHPHLGCRGAGHAVAHALRRAGIRPGPAASARLGSPRTCPVHRCGSLRLRAPALRPGHSHLPRLRSMPRQSGARPAACPELASPPVTPPAEKNGPVPDPYTGGGTVAIAAKKPGRNYVGIGISPKHCDAAQERVDEAP